MHVLDQLNDQAKRILANLIKTRGKREWWFSTRYYYMTSNLRLSYHEGDNIWIRADILVGHDWISTHYQPGPWDQDIVNLAAELIKQEDARTLLDYDMSKKLTATVESSRFKKLEF